MNMKKQLSIGVLLALAASSAVGEEVWQASWIGVAETSGRQAGPSTKGPDIVIQKANLWTCFRKSVSLEAAPRRAVARIAVDSKYWLWINGELVVFEGQLKRGPNPNDTYYDRVDLTGHLQKGENTVAILVWYYGKDGFSHKSSGRSGLVFDATIDGRVLPSDSSWKAVVHPAYENTGAPHRTFACPSPTSASTPAKTSSAGKPRASTTARGLQPPSTASRRAHRGTNWSNAPSRYGRTSG